MLHHCRYSNSGSGGASIKHLTIQIKPCFSLRNVCLLLLFNLYTTVNLPLSFNSFREETIIFLKKLVKEKRVNQITERWSYYQLIWYLNSTIVISLFSQLIRRGTSAETMGKTFSVFCIKKCFCQTYRVFLHIWKTTSPQADFFLDFEWTRPVLQNS